MPVVQPKSEPVTDIDGLLALAKQYTIGGRVQWKRVAEVERFSSYDIGKLRDTWRRAIGKMERKRKFERYAKGNFDHSN
jgi:hypothetical protein